MQIRGNTFQKKVKHSSNTINKLKAKMQKTTQEARREEESKQKLSHVINIVCSNVDDVEISHDMPSEDKVIRMGKITTNLKKKVTEL